MSGRLVTVKNVGVKNKLNTSGKFIPAGTVVEVYTTRDRQLAVREGAFAVILPEELRDADGPAYVEVPRDALGTL